MTPRCEEIDQLLAAFALDAVDEDERLAVLQHLSECRLHDAELANYREVAGLLPLALEDVAPEPALRGRLLAEFDPAAAVTPVAGPVDATPTPLRPLPAATPPRRGLLDIFRAPALGYGLAAALLLLVMGLAAWNLSLRGDERDILASTTTQDGMSLQVYYLEDEGLAVLKLEMPPLSGGRVYQAWQLVDGGPVSLGVVTGSGVTAVPADLQQASAVAISVEPPGGSAAPTTTPVLVAEL